MLEENEPDRKRPRVDEDGDSRSPPHYTNHPNLYFGDGNVILRCQKTYFRVHRTLLTRNSPVFRDILAERDRVGGDQFRGCILLTLEDDVDDMQQLLNRVYDGFDIDVPELTATTFPGLASILRLVMKYQIKRPQKAIFDLLRREWPSTLEMYDVKAALPRADGLDCEEYTVIHPATVIGLLRECGYLSSDLFAPLFYELSTHIWEFTKPVSSHHLDDLSLSDTQRFVVGVNKLRALHVREARCPLSVVQHNACQAALAVGWCGEAYNILHYQGNDMCNPLESFAVLIARTRLPTGAEAPSPRAVPNERPHAGPAAPPPPYNAPLCVGRGQLGQGMNPVVYRPLGMLRAGQGQWPAFNGSPRSNPVHQPALAAPPAPPNLPLPQPQQPGHAPRFVQPLQVQPQPRALQPLFDGVCGPCRQAFVQSLEASRQKIWDSLPELFNLL